jgi:hypothetical protein
MREKLTVTPPPAHLSDEQKLAWKVLAGLGIKEPQWLVNRFPAKRILAVLYTMRLRGKSLGWLVKALQDDWEVQEPTPRVPPTRDAPRCPSPRRSNSCASIAAAANPPKTPCASSRR